MSSFTVLLHTDGYSYTKRGVKKKITIPRGPKAGAKKKLESGGLPLRNQFDGDDRFDDIGDDVVCTYPCKLLLSLYLKLSSLRRQHVTCVWV